MKKLFLIALIGLGTWQAGLAQRQPEDLKLEMDNFQQQMMKMLEQFGFQEGAPGMMMDTLLIQPFGLFPGVDSLQNQDFMKQWQAMSEQLLKSLQGAGGIDGFGEFFKNFPGFDSEGFPVVPMDPKSLEEGTSPKNKKKRKIYKI